MATMGLLRSLKWDRKIFGRQKFKRSISPVYYQKKLAVEQKLLNRVSLGEAHTFFYDLFQQSKLKNRL